MFAQWPYVKSSSDKSNDQPLIRLLEMLNTVFILFFFCFLHSGLITAGQMKKRRHFFRSCLNISTSMEVLKINSTAIQKSSLVNFSGFWTPEKHNESRHSWIRRLSTVGSKVIHWKDENSYRSEKINLCTITANQQSNMLVIVWWFGLKMLFL